MKLSTRGPSNVARPVLVGVLALLAFAAPAHAAFPGADGKIAFETNRAGNYQIYTVSPDGSGLTRLTNNSAHDLRPAWSPDGKKVVFMRQFPDATRAIFAINADGTGETLVTYGVDPAWSPDGQRIVFARLGRDTEGGGIFVANVDGTGEAKIAPGFRDDRSPEWSPDGQKVAFTDASLSGTSNIYSVNSDGTGLTALTSSGRDFGPTWSPDGARIAFTGYDQNLQQTDIYAMNRDGSARTQLTSTPDSEQDPAWSPSGNKIAISSNAGGQWDIATMNADGTGLTKLTNDPAVDTSPDWQPIPQSYVRPKSASPLRTALVVAFKPCTVPIETHGPPLAYGSCNPPDQASSYLTVGVPPQDPANSVGSVRYTAFSCPACAGPGPNADVQTVVSITDVRNRLDLSDYAGELRVDAPLRITDRDNSPNPGGPGPATVTDTGFPITTPCAATADTTIGSTCSISTSANAVVPNSVVAGKRTIWQMGQVQVYDGGRDGVGSTTGDNTVFMDQGIFVP
jgi:hypothetical protein